MDTTTLSQLDLAKEQMERENKEIANNQPTFEVQVSEAEQREIDKVKSQISFYDNDVAEKFGRDGSYANAELVDRVMGEVKANEMGEAGKVASELVIKLSTDEEVDKPALKNLFGLLTKAKTELELLKIRNESALANIDRAMGQMKADMVMLKVNTKLVEDLQVENLNNFKYLRVRVEAGRQAIEEARAYELPRLQKIASETGDQADLNKAAAFEDNITLLEMKVHDLDSMMSLSQVLAVNLQSIANGNRGMVQKIDRVITTVIPSWKMFMSTAFVNAQTNAAANRMLLAEEAGNELFKKASGSIRETSKKVAELNQRGAVSIETIEAVTNDVIGMLQDVENAEQNGRQMRADAARRLEENRAKLASQVAKMIDHSAAVNREQTIAQSMEESI